MGDNAGSHFFSKYHVIGYTGLLSIRSMEWSQIWFDSKIYPQFLTKKLEFRSDLTVPISSPSNMWQVVLGHMISVARKNPWPLKCK